jgi:hypothetical protein
VIPWTQAYLRTVRSPDAILKFGRELSIDDFRFEARVVRFDAVSPALLATSVAAPNTGDLAVTRAALAAPATPIVPGPASTSKLDFDEGGIILAITSAAMMPQRIANNGGALDFKYGPSSNSVEGGNQDLFALDLDYSDGSNIVGQNPILETVRNPNSPVITGPPAMGDALQGNGSRSNALCRELLIAPGLGVIVQVRSLVLPNLANVFVAGQVNPNAPNMSVHLVFHSMIPKTKPQKRSDNN